MMFAALTVLATLASFVRADAIPTAPSPGNVFNEGTSCTTQWTPDTTGTWTQMTIELMTGDNLSQIPLMNVTTLNGADPTLTSFSFPCPNVTPNSAIYFYKYSAAGQTDVQFTTRFAIATPQGQTTAPPNATQPGGQAIPWGVGELVGSGSGSSTSSSTSTSSSSSSSGSSSSSSSATSKSSSSSSSSSSATTTSAPSSTAAPSITTSIKPTSTAVVVVNPTTSANSSNSGAGALRVGRASVYGAGSALVAVAAAMVVGF